MLILSKVKKLLLVMILLVSRTSFAQQKGTVDYPYLGVKFTIPKGWVGQESDEAYLMGSTTQPGLIVLLPNEAVSLSDLKKDAKSGLYDKGTELTLTGKLEQFGSEGIGAEFGGTVQGTKAKAYIIGLVNPFGTGVSIIATTDIPNYSDVYRKLAEEVASKVQFRQPEEPEMVGEWRKDLPGAKLVYMKSSYNSGASYGGYSTYSSYSSRKQIVFCSNNQFSYISSSQASFDSGAGFGSTGGGGDGSGTWSVAGDADGNSILKLIFTDGQERSYILSYKESKTYLDGTRYFFISPNGICK